MRTVLVQQEAPTLPVHADPAVDAAIHGVGEIFEALRPLGYEESNPRFEARLLAPIRAPQPDSDLNLNDML